MADFKSARPIETYNLAAVISSKSKARDGRTDGSGATNLCYLFS